MADSLLPGLYSPRKEWPASCSSYCSFGTRRTKPPAGCRGFQPNYIVIEKGAIDTIPEIPGLAVWHEGHIGIYIGNGEVVQAANTNAGVIRTPIDQGGWTHWLKIPYIQYIEESEDAT